LFSSLWGQKLKANDFFMASESLSGALVLNQLSSNRVLIL